MADYWKSGERHYCTFCKCWLAGNKVSIELHERGNHHKNMVKAKVEQLRKGKIEKEQQDRKFNETLGQIEHAAHESYRRDMVAQATNTLNNRQTSTASSSSDANLPSKLKRPINQPVQVQCKKPKFVIKTPTPKPVFEPIVPPSEPEKEVESNTEIPKQDEKKEDKVEQTEEEEEEEEEVPTSQTNREGIWYESKTEANESFYWNDTTGESTWTPPTNYLSIEQQRAKGLNV